MKGKSLDFFRGKRVLITGAAGFIGANLLRRLMTCDTDLHILLKPTSNLWRIQDILPAVTTHSVRLTDLAKLQKLLKKLRPEIIFHLAAHGGYSFQRAPQAIIEANLWGTIQLLLATQDIAYEAFINTGSSSEYGYKDQPMSETDFLEPASYYAATKAGATLFAQTMAKLEKKPIITLRLFSVYGPWEEPTRLVPTVIRNALANKPILMTSGKEARDFVYIDDVIEAYLLTACQAKALSGEIFNIGTGQQSSVREVVDQVIALTKSTSTIKKDTYALRPWDTTMWVADTTHTKKFLDWSARTTLEAGLKKTLAWIKTSVKNRFAGLV